MGETMESIHKKKNVLIPNCMLNHVYLRSHNCYIFTTRPINFIRKQIMIKIYKLFAYKFPHHL